MAAASLGLHDSLGKEKAGTVTKLEPSFWTVFRFIQKMVTSPDFHSHLLDRMMSQDHSSIRVGENKSFSAGLIPPPTPQLEEGVVSG